MLNSRATSRSILIKLILHDGIGSVLVAQLCKNGGYDRLLQLPLLSASQIIKQFCISERQAVLVHAALQEDGLLEPHDVWCAANNVRTLLLMDDDYPELLRHLGAPPVVLWVRGELPRSGTACALVGSRDATHYGKRVVQMLVPALVAQGIVTVSGGARGIDGWVHDETIKAGGKTLVVMGCGLAHTYPPEHADLFERVVASGGALVSPFPPHTEPSRWSFPVRNRLIAGLATACIVVQAAAKSGALITASHALEENREVGAVPGPIDELVSAGCNTLLAHGARVIVDGQSAVELCGQTGHAMPAGASKEVVYGEVLALIDRPQTLEELLEVYEGTPVELQEKLFALQLAGNIRQNHAGQWVRCG
ncbi:MAG: processing protein [Candidatus Dependentiae bacterium]|nr:processing protein [Candidatus Dependentiae bacterium]